MTDSTVTVVPVESAPPPKPRREWKLLGPHFYFDIIRLARGRRVRDLRMLYTLGMLLAMLILYMARFHATLWDLFFGAGQTIPTNDLANFGERFVFSILFVQNLAVFLMTPIYLGSCITEEKERRSLELLFMSPLRNHEILLGKLLARMAHLGGVLLASLPILSLAQLWGGIDMGIILLNFANTLGNLLSVGCFSLLVSVLMKRTLTAVMTIYGVMILPLLIFGAMGLSGGATPFGFLQFHTATWLVFSTLFVFHAIVATLSTFLAHMFLRRPAEVPPRWQEPPRRPKKVRAVTPVETERTIRQVRDFKVPPVTEEPLLWKEYYFGPRPHSHLVFWMLSTAFVFVPVGIGSLTALIAAGVNPHNQLDGLGAFLRFYAVVCAMFYILWSAFRAAGSLVRERQHKTLDELLTMPIERATILGYKWLGSVLHGWMFACFFGAVVFFAMVTTALHFAACLLLLGSVMIHAFFWTTLGLYYSVVCRTVLSAYLRLGLTLLLVIVGTALYAGIVNFDRNDWTGYFLSCGLNPLATWWILGFTNYEIGQPGFDPAGVRGCLAGVMAYVLLTLSLGLLTHGKFQRERYRHVE